MGKQVPFDTRRVAKEVNGNRVDDEKGLFLQTGPLGKLYQPWIHIPYKKNSVFMFSSGTKPLEKLIELTSFVPIHIMPLFWGPIILYELSLASSTMNSIFLLFTSFLFGVIILWSTFEYFVHRWIFHMLTESPLGNMIHYMIHGIHHLTPSDPYRGVFPPTPAVLGMLIPTHAIFWAIGKYIGKNLLGLSDEVEYMLRLSIHAGFLTGYLMYDCIHWYYHNGAKPPQGLLYKLPFGIGDYFILLRKCHMQHHYVKGAEVYNFALTPFVKLIYDDWIFKTSIDYHVTKFPDVYTYDEDEDSQIFKFTSRDSQETK